jgi:hypothetical protein
MVRTVRGLLERGYPVLVRAMPFMHWNAQPIADPHDAATLVTLTSHDGLARWESPGFSALTFFLEPVAVAGRSPPPPPSAPERRASTGVSAAGRPPRQPQGPG